MCKKRVTSLCVFSDLFFFSSFFFFVGGGGRGDLDFITHFNMVSDEIQNMREDP